MDAMPGSADFWALAGTRTKDAEELLGTKRWACAYHVSGYIVECALKAFIVREAEQQGVGTFFDNKQFSLKRINDFFAHNLENLLAAAKLEPDFKAAQKTDPDLTTNWDIVKGWNESSRYESKGQAEAEAMFKAINGDPHGVMTWLRKRY
jgi:hypothetical protein